MATEIDVGRGVVVRFGPQGYGFAKDDETGQPVFINQCDIDMPGFRKLDKGDIVEYQIVKNDKGLKGENVTIIEKSDTSRRSYGGGHSHGRQSNRGKVEQDLGKCIKRVSRIDHMVHRLIEVLSNIEDDEPIINEEEKKFILEGDE